MALGLTALSCQQCWQDRGGGVGGPGTCSPAPRATARLPRSRCQIPGLRATWSPAPLATPAQIVAGVLFKYVNLGAGWRPRLFVLKEGVLRYYKIKVWRACTRRAAGFFPLRALRGDGGGGGGPRALGRGLVGGATPTGPAATLIRLAPARPPPQQAVRVHQLLETLRQQGELFLVGAEVSMLEHSDIRGSHSGSRTPGTGSCARLPTAQGEMHLQVASVRDSTADCRKLYVHTGMQVVSLRAEST